MSVSLFRESGNTEMVMFLHSSFTIALLTESGPHPHHLPVLRLFPLGNLKNIKVEPFERITAGKKERD